MKTLNSHTKNSLFVASLRFAFALACVAPSSISHGASGPIKFMEILTGQNANVPARKIYADGVRYLSEAAMFAGCAEFDATDEISAEKTFKILDSDEALRAYYKRINLFEFNYRAAKPESQLCEKGRKVFINLGGMTPMVSTRTMFGSDGFQDQYATLSFERFLSGGSGMRMKLQIDVKKKQNESSEPFSQLWEYTPNSLAEEGTLTWEGDFFVKDCETDSGDAVDVSQPQLKSVADILTTQEEVMHPQFVRCNFTTKEMISRDTPFWRGEHGEIFPRLKQVTLTVHPFYASLSYQALNGLKFKAERLRALRSKGGDTSRLFESTQALMDVLNGVIPALVLQDAGARLPSTIAYLRNHRNEILGYLANINQQLQDPNAPFDAIFNVTLSLNRAYQFLDQALGLTLPERITFARAMEMASLKEAR
jgi:hypothetical protein